MKAKKTNKAKMVIRKELVSSPVEEWFEFRVYRGKPKEGTAIASFTDEKEAFSYVKEAKAEATYIGTPYVYEAA